MVPPAAPGAAQTTLAFKVEQSKIPEFFGQKGKDNITAIVFIRKIDDLAHTNRWTDTATYANMANNLKGFARDWLFATVEMLDWTASQLTWMNFKPRFQWQFATQTDKKMIMEGLSNLAMKLGESTGELLAWITKTMVIMKDSYASYENKPAAQHITMSTTDSNPTNPTNKSGSKGYSNNYRSSTGPGNNANRNGKYCFYCKLQNHTQKECFKRFRDKKLCKDRQGRAYWPRVYLTENSDSQNQGQQPVFH